MNKRNNVFSGILVLIFFLLNFFNAFNVLAVDTDFSRDVTVIRNNKILVSDSSTKDTVYEALKEVLDKHSIDYDIKDGQWGKYINSIDKLAAGEFSKNAGWVYITKRQGQYIEGMTSIDAAKLEKDDKVLVYYSEYGKTFVANKIEYSTLEESKPLDITISNISKNWATGKDEVTPVKNIKAKIDEKEVLVVANKIHLEKGLKKGKHILELSDFREEECPNVLRDTFEFEIKKSNSNNEPNSNENNSNEETGSSNSNENNSNENNGSSNANNNNNGLISLNKEFEKTLNYMKNQSIDPWMAVTFKNLGMDFNKDYIKEFEKDLIKNGVESYSNTELEKMIIGLMAAGYNPHKFGTYDLPKILYNRDMKNFLINDALFGLIAYNYGNISGDYFIKKDTLKNYLLNNLIHSKIDDKDYYGWNWYTGAKDIDIDMTSMVINALAPYYKEDKKVKDALDRAVKTLSYMENEKGYMLGTYGISSESIACTIVAISSIGVDPNTSSDFKKANGDLVSALLSFKLENGTFKHELKDSKGNNFSTEQALRAYVAMENFKDNGCGYNYYGNNVQAERLPVYNIKEDNKKRNNNTNNKNNNNANNFNKINKQTNKDNRIKILNQYSNDRIIYPNNSTILLEDNKVKNPLKELEIKTREYSLENTNENKAENKKNTDENKPENRKNTNHDNSKNNKQINNGNKNKTENKNSINRFFTTEKKSTIIIGGIVITALISLYFIWKKK